MILFLLILSVIVGALLGKKFGQHKKFAKNLLVFSAGFLITICLNEVFPEVYGNQQKNIGLFVILGVLLQMLLENLTKGFEHGHFHQEEERANIFPAALIIGLFVHAFIEGIPLANIDIINSPYLLGIVVHNIPISFILGVYLFRNGITKSGLLIIALFALSSPLGMSIGKYFDSDLQIYFLAIVGGIFLHISSVIIFESNKNHKMDWEKLLMVILGVIVAISGHLLHSH